MTETTYRPQPVINLTGAIRDISIMPGDSVDMATFGVIVWLDQEDAEAYRLVLKKRQRETRTTIDHVEKRSR